MKNIVFALLFFSALINAQTTDQFFDKSDEFLKLHVKNGMVDYQAIKTNPEKLNELFNVAQSLEVSKDQADVFQAFWINSYNLAVIKGIIDNYPVKSPLDVPGFFDKVKYQIAGKSLTLNSIENEILRAQFNEPRFHFVLVCGAKGCPPLISVAYLPQTLETQLQKQTAIALNNDDFIKVRSKEIALSEIFKWYREDFLDQGSELDFINIYRKAKLNPKLPISYYPYDWALNIQN